MPHLKRHKGGLALLLALPNLLGLSLPLCCCFPLPLLHCERQADQPGALSSEEPPSLQLRLPDVLADCELGPTVQTRSRDLAHLVSIESNPPRFDCEAGCECSHRVLIEEVFARLQLQVDLGGRLRRRERRVRLLLVDDRWLLPVNAMSPSSVSRACTRHRRTWSGSEEEDCRVAERDTGRAAHRFTFFFLNLGRKRSQFSLASCKAKEVR